MLFYPKGLFGWNEPHFRSPRHLLLILVSTNKIMITPAGRIDHGCLRCNHERHWSCSQPCHAHLRLAKHSPYGYAHSSSANLPPHSTTIRHINQRNSVRYYHQARTHNMLSNFIILAAPWISTTRIIEATKDCLYISLIRK